MRAITPLVLVVVMSAPGCATRDQTRQIAVYTDRVADVMTQLQDSAERFHATKRPDGQPVLPDDEYQAYLRVAEKVADRGVKVSQAIQAYEARPSDETQAELLAGLDALNLALPELFDALNTSEFRTEVIRLVIEAQKLIHNIRGDAQ